MTTASLFIGLMSGTSLDGIDAVIVSFDEDSQNTLGSAYLPYPEKLRHDILSLHDAGYDELHRSSLLAQELASLYSQASQKVLAKTSINSQQIRAIGCHGQTIRHRPELGYTLQLNNPSLLAELTCIPVISDFRSRDIAAGGQGAPLVPAAHQALFQSPTKNRALLNLGGIANLTYLPHCGTTTPVFGFDCGPANILMDAWSQDQRHIAYDADGAWARSGKLLPELLSRLLDHCFFEQQPPKSCGREEFNIHWLKTFLSDDDASADIERTLLELTCRVCANALLQWMPDTEELYLCGGGAHNSLLMERLASHLPQIMIATTDSLGISPNAVEAVAFAWLARQHILGQPGNLPAVTGAKGLRVLGAYHPA